MRLLKTFSWDSATRTRLCALALLAAGCAVLAVAEYSPDWQRLFAACLASVALAAVLGVLALGFAPGNPEAQALKPKRRSARAILILAGLLLFHAATAITVERHIPGDTIDCFSFERDALTTLLHGRDPYGTTQKNIYTPAETSQFYGSGMVVDGRVQVGFQYPPATLLWGLPGYWLGDVRYSFVAAVMLSAVACFFAIPGDRGLLLAAFLLLNPVAFLVESRCWTEPLVLLGISLTLYAAERKHAWLPLAVGFLLAAKQYNLLALPLLGLLVDPFRWRPYLKLLALSSAVAAATVLPFALWNRYALWHDLVLFHLAQPFRADALSFAIPFPLARTLGPLALLLFLFWSARMGARRPAIFAAAYAIGLLLFFATSKQAFCNYYYLIGSVLLLAAAALGNPAGERSSSDGALERSSLHPKAEVAC